MVFKTTISTAWIKVPHGVGEGLRSLYLCVGNAVLCQLSYAYIWSQLLVTLQASLRRRIYSPPHLFNGIRCDMVREVRLELTTFRSQAGRSSN